MVIVRWCLFKVNNILVILTIAEIWVSVVIENVLHYNTYKHSADRVLELLTLTFIFLFSFTLTCEYQLLLQQFSYHLNAEISFAKTMDMHRIFFQLILI